MILVRGRARSATSVRSTWKPHLAAVDAPGVALGARHGDHVARPARWSVASPVPTTAGMPSSRATIAAWQVRPPRLVTIAAAIFMTGSQSGVVVSATSTSPGRNSDRCWTSSIRRPAPEAIFSPTDGPR